jgi:hypothetical protein
MPLSEYTYQDFTNQMMCCLGFFAFLRCGEFTTNSKFDPHQHLSDKDIAVDNHHEPSLLSIHLKKSKTDQEGLGITLYVGQTAQVICPVTALLSYLVVRKAKFPSGPLFVLEDGSPLARQALVSWLRTTLNSSGIDASHFSGHSFRIGAASTAAARGVIQALGRWKSDSFRRYIRIPREELATISSAIAN